MIDIKQLKEQQREKHPGFNSYLECMTRTLLTGLASFTLGFSGLYFAQKLLQHRLPYNREFNVLVSTVGATFVAYRITKDRTRTCQAAWMAAEDKHTALRSINSPSEEHLQEQDNNQDKRL